jgi:hypothetical protein
MFMIIANCCNAVRLNNIGVSTLKMAIAPNHVGVN